MSKGRDRLRKENTGGREAKKVSDSDFDEKQLARRIKHDPFSVAILVCLNQCNSNDSKIVKM